MKCSFNSKIEYTGYHYHVWKNSDEIERDTIFFNFDEANEYAKSNGYKLIGKWKQYTHDGKTISDTEWIEDIDVKGGANMYLDIDKFNKYMSDNNIENQPMIREMGTVENAMEIYRKEDGLLFSNVEEMKEYCEGYYFILNGIWFHILYDEAKDVINNNSNQYNTTTKKREINNINVLEKAKEIACKLGWRSVKINSDDSEVLELEFRKESPAGRDFTLCVYMENGDIESLINSIYERYKNYDCSEETYYLLDSTGHGINGTLYNMKDLYEDVEACEDMIWELYKKLREENWSVFKEEK